jgi:hypothetical protein
MRNLKRILPLAAAILLASTTSALGVSVSKEITMPPNFTISSFAATNASLGFSRFRLEFAASGYRTKKAVSTVPAQHPRKFNMEWHNGAIAKGKHGIQLSLAWAASSEGFEKNTYYDLRLSFGREPKKSRSIKPRNKAEVSAIPSRLAE